MTNLQGANELTRPLYGIKFENLRVGFWLNDMKVFIRVEQRQGEPLFAFLSFPDDNCTVNAG